MATNLFETDNDFNVLQNEDNWETMEDLLESSYDENMEEREYSISEIESLVKNWSDAIRLNRYYGSKLGWDQYYDNINDLLLPYAARQNVSLSEDSLAQAIADWQILQGLSADGVIGPNTWNKMKPLLNYVAPPQPTPALPTGTMPPSVQNIFDFNRWHAKKIVDSMNAGIIGTNFNSKHQLEKIIRGEQVVNVNPNTRIINILPVIYHIAEQAQLNNYREIMIGSFIRSAAGDGSCTGHCAGRCIDINFRGESFETPGAVQMVRNILSYLLTLPSQYKRMLGFGLPLQGNFFGHKNLNKFKSVPVSNIIDNQLQQLIPQLGIVFPDNDNHLHIQIKWLTP